MDNWKQYEKEVHEYLSERFPNTEIAYDVKIPGHYSRTERQIDILIKNDVAGVPIKIAVDTKYFSKKVDVKCVESFISMMNDVDVHQGLMFTNKGYSKAALNRAYYGPEKIELDVLNYDELEEYQGFMGIPYAGDYAIVLSAPIGWIIDINTGTQGYTSCLYQRGLTFIEARKRNEYMYINFSEKEKNIKNITDLVNFQNEKMESHYTDLKLESTDSIKRDDKADTYIRIATAKEMPFKEITGFIDFPNFIVFFVLFTPEESESVNIKRLKYVLQYSHPMEMIFDNSKIIEQLKNKSIKISDPMEKSECYRQIADWYKEMKEEKQSIKYRRLSYQEFPKNYCNIRKLISEELSLSNWGAALDVSVVFFDMDSTNPRVMQDILCIYDDTNCFNILAQLIIKLEKQYLNNMEALGNIRYHYGLFLHDQEKLNKSIDYMKKAKENFEFKFPKGHYVIDQISQFLKENKI